MGNFSTTMKQHTLVMWSFCIFVILFFCSFVGTGWVTEPYAYTTIAFSHAIPFGPLTAVFESGVRIGRGGRV